MIAPTQIRPPENWQDFELLCKKLWGEIWNCPDTIKRNGRSGQEQCGVDIYGAPNGGVEYYGIQCKGKDNYTHAKLTTKEIDDEITKAQSFKPVLKAFYFATTAVKDATIEEYIREKNIENINNGGFVIDIFSWEDIVDLLKEHRSTYNWYINNSQYVDSPNVSITITPERGKSALHPRYIHLIKKYKVREHNFDIAPFFTIPKGAIVDPPHQRIRVDYRWCDIYFKVSNIGSTTINDYKIYIQIDNCQKLSCKVHYCNDFLMNQATITAINDKIDRERELFETQYGNVLEFRPKQTCLLKGDFKNFIVGVKPKNNVEEIIVKWTLLSKDYQKKGKIAISVKPIIEDKETIIYVDSQSELKPDEEIIKPKIIEE